jgi:hypothetical protein
MSALHPIRSDNAPATGDRHGVAVHGKRRSPVPSGEFPTANWKNWLVRNTAQNVDAVMSNNPPTAAEKVASRNIESGIIGSSALASQARNATRRQRPPAKLATIPGLVHPSRDACTSPRTSATEAPETSTRPGTSRRERGPWLSGRMNLEPIKARTPTGTFTQKIQCQLRPWVTAPPTRGPPIAPSPAIPLQMPMTAPRRSGGKADVRMVRLSGVMMAAPRPCTVRAAMRKPAEGARAQAADAAVKITLLSRFVEAFEAADVTGIVACLTEDAWVRMPPVPLEYQGRDSAAQFFATVSFRRGRRFRLIPTRANGQPAFGVYLRDPVAAVGHAHGLLVVTLAGDQLSAITGFDNAVFDRFGLPRILAD